MNCYSHVTLSFSYRKIEEEIHLEYNYKYQATSINRPSFDVIFDLWGGRHMLYLIYEIYTLYMIYFEGFVRYQLATQWYIRTIFIIEHIWQRYGNKGN
jgi:hypothetical protein